MKDITVTDDFFILTVTLLFLLGCFADPITTLATILFWSGALVITVLNIRRGK